MPLSALPRFRLPAIAGGLAVLALALGAAGPARAQQAAEVAVPALQPAPVNHGQGAIPYEDRLKYSTACKATSAPCSGTK